MDMLAGNIVLMAILAGELCCLSVWQCWLPIWLAFYDGSLSKFDMFAGSAFYASWLF
jgi:hypothetical protein